MNPHHKKAVTSPQTRLAHTRRRYRRPWRPSTLDPAEAPRAVELYRVQSRNAIITLVQLFILVFGLPLLLVTQPWLSEVRLVGIPVWWLIPIVVPFPAMVVLAFRHLRRAETPEGVPGSAYPPGNPSGAAPAAAESTAPPAGNTAGNPAEDPAQDQP